MYPLSQIYSLEAYRQWRSSPLVGGQVELRKHFSQWKQVRDATWDIKDWDELQSAVSFLTLMNKRSVLYFRGQGEHYHRCLPTLFRDEWTLNNCKYQLTKKNRPEYYLAVPQLQDEVFKVVEAIGTPRYYILKYIPGAAAAILQHYELWPTHFIDVTRSLQIALAFSQGTGIRTESTLYVFGMPDLRGSITSDIDQHISLARLEAICPPDAKRPHRQDAYLVSRFPEPSGLLRSGEMRWDEWTRHVDLMTRVVARFRISLSNGRLRGAPEISRAFLVPPVSKDFFGRELRDRIAPIASKLAASFSA